MPTFARAAARSREELFERMRSATLLVLNVVIPVSLFISVGADLWVRILFGAAFAPAAMAVRILATTFVLMYVGMIYAITLMMLERAWTLTVIAFGGLVVNVAINLSAHSLFDGGIRRRRRRRWHALSRCSEPRSPSTPR